MLDTRNRCLTDAERRSTAWTGQDKGETLVDRSSSLAVEWYTPGGRRLLQAASSSPPLWLQPTLQRIGELMGLPRGWDSYGAVPVDENVVVFSLTILPLIMGDATPPPQIVPTSEGGLQFDWHEGGIDLEVEIAGPFRIRAYFEDAHSVESWEKEFTRDVGPLADAVRRLDPRPEDRR